MKENKEKTLHLKWFGIPKLLPYLTPYRKQIFFMIVLGAIGSIIDIIIPLFQRFAINNYITKGVTDGILWFVCFML